MLCPWSDQYEIWPFLWFLMCGLVQVLFFRLSVNFLMAIFMPQPLGLDLFLGTYCNKLLLMVPRD